MKFPLSPLSYVWSARIHCTWMISSTPWPELSTDFCRSECQYVLTVLSELQALWTGQ